VGSVSPSFRPPGSRKEGPILEVRSVKGGKGGLALEGMGGGFQILNEIITEGDYKSVKGADQEGVKWGGEAIGNLPEGKSSL